MKLDPIARKILIVLVLGLLGMFGVGVLSGEIDLDRKADPVVVVVVPSTTETTLPAWYYETGGDPHG